MDQIVLSVVIGTRNRLAILKQCLDSLIGRIDVAHEIIVVDAGSTDGTLEYLKDLTGIRLVCDGALIGQSRSLNRVFKTLTSKYVCWLSDDNLAQPGMLDQAVSILEQHPKIGLVGLKVKDISGRFATEEYIGGIWPSGILNCNQGMLPMALVNKLGGFDEQFREYGIDSDLTTRILLAGYQVVYTRQVAIHHLRDHDTVSWIDSDGRQQRKLYAKEVYRQKFAALITSAPASSYNKSRRENALLLRIILLGYGYARKLGIPLQAWLGLSERDWQNLFLARFVSKRDFLTTRKKPYYLVQQMPDRLLHELSGKF